jgi:hypothetical protein
VPYPRLAPEDDRPFPLVPPKYADGIRRQCDGSTVLTFSPHMLDGETRATEAQPVLRRQNRPSAGGGLREPGRRRLATTVRVCRRRLER